MDGLDDFEKQLAADKAERERTDQESTEKKERRHRHHHRRHRERSAEREDDQLERDRTREYGKDGEGDGRRHNRSRDDGLDEDRHRHKRSRQHRDDDSSSRHKRETRHADQDRDTARDNSSEEPAFIRSTDPKEKLPLPDEEVARSDPRPPKRDSWMTAPSALDIDYIHRKSDRREEPRSKEEPKRIIHKNELNNATLEELNNGKMVEDIEVQKQSVDYTFGDEGSQWRMTKLKGVYTIAEQTGRPVEEIAVERLGSLREFDEAREEKIEMDRRKVYGDGYVGKDKPTGELYKERMAKMKPEASRDVAPTLPEEPEQGVTIPDTAPPVDQTALNRLRAQMMKAKLRKAPDAEKLETEYNAALRSFNTNASSDRAVVLDASNNRMLAGARGEVQSVDTKRGRERGLVKENEDMSVEDMVREERRTRGQAGGEGMRLAERIAKDGKFDDDLEYLDENAEKLAKRIHKSEANLKNTAISEFQKMNKILDTCPLCHHEDRNPPQNLPIAPIVSLATRVYLTLPTEPELTGAEGGAIIVPISHRGNLLECDDDEWEEMRNFMKSLTRLYHDQGREVIFYENAAAPQRRLHAALVAVPIPYDLGDTAPAFFREAMLSTDEEWSQHKKIIDTGKRSREGVGKLAFRRSIAKEMPYFHVWFTLDGGLGHVVENSERWPRGDLFAREIIGGMMDVEPDVIKRQGRWSRGDQRVDGFRKRWRKFDWTRVLTEG